MSSFFDFDKFEDAARWARDVVADTTRPADDPELARAVLVYLAAEPNRTK